MLAYNFTNIINLILLVSFAFPTEFRATYSYFFGRPRCERIFSGHDLPPGMTNVRTLHLYDDSGHSELQGEVFIIHSEERVEPVDVSMPSYSSLVGSKDSMVFLFGGGPGLSGAT